MPKDEWKQNNLNLLDQLVNQQMEIVQENKDLVQSTSATGTSFTEMHSLSIAQNSQGVVEDKEKH